MKSRTNRILRHPSDSKVKIFVHITFADQPFYSFRRYGAQEIEWLGFKTKLISNIREVHISGPATNILNALEETCSHKVIANDPDKPPLCMTLYTSREISNSVKALSRRKAMRSASLTNPSLRISRVLIGALDWYKSKKTRIILSSGPLFEKGFMSFNLFSPPTRVPDKDIWNIMWDNNEATMLEIASVFREYVDKVGIYGYGVGERWEASKDHLTERVGQMG